ncbi:hypothetical protein I553_6020 [Mycobacterium xenopi 4042]|uniref:Uncharacterized protein n=1 Tax=Mycobacterium xenopi 4042 TaxID=1299334 RepID=X8BGG5_MYCXE|nr:hypothetical protein I553_6020 [Mycobacterium xenopi 4042]
MSVNYVHTEGHRRRGRAATSPSHVELWHWPTYPRSAGKPLGTTP